jgi:hypothetical protein
MKNCVDLLMQYPRIAVPNATGTVEYLRPLRLTLAELRRALDLLEEAAESNRTIIEFQTLVELAAVLGVNDNAPIIIGILRGCQS